MVSRSVSLFILILMMHPSASAQWVQTSGPSGASITCMAANSTLLFAGTKTGGVFRSGNDGDLWTEARGGMKDTRMLSLAADPTGTFLFAGTKTGLYRTTNNGDDWTKLSTGLPDVAVTAIGMSSAYMVVGTDNAAFYRSTDFGQSWSPGNKEASFGRTMFVAIKGTTCLATAGGSLFRSTDSGANWAKITMSERLSALAVSGESFYAGESGFYESTDDGLNWTRISSYPQLDQLLVDGTTLIGAWGNEYGGVYRSTNGGAEWTFIPLYGAIWTGSAYPVPMTLNPASGPAGDKHVFVGGDYSGVLRSTDSGLHWTPASRGLGAGGVSSLVDKGTAGLFAGTWLGVARTTDGGRRWEPTTDGMSDFRVMSLAAVGTDLYAGTSLSAAGDGSIYRSTDTGSSWTGSTVRRAVTCFAYSEPYVFAGGAYNGSVYRSSDSGTTWERPDSSFRNYVNDLEVCPVLPPTGDSLLVAATYSEGVFFSTDRGKSWTDRSAGLPGRNVATLARDGTHLFAGVSLGVMGGPSVVVTTDNGETWMSFSGNLPHALGPHTFLVMDDMIFLGSERGVFYSRVTSPIWVQMNEGLTDSAVMALSTHNGFLYAGTGSNGVWRHAMGFWVPQGTWNEQPELTIDPLYSVRSPGGGVAWAGGAGGTVLRTTNGGAAWTPAGLTEFDTTIVWAIDALDQDRAFAVSCPAGVATIYRTTDGGAAWRPAYTEPGGFINGIRMIDASNGVAIGDPLGGRWTLLKTTDGGESWAHMPSEPPASPGERGFPNAVSLGGSDFFWFGTSSGDVWLSRDGGVTWSSASTTLSRVMSLCFIDKVTGLAGGPHGEAARTLDGGVTWMTVTLPGSGDVRAIAGSGVDFWAARGEALFRSTDRGASWALDYVGKIGELTGVDFARRLADGDGYAVGMGGGIATSTEVLTGLELPAFREVPRRFLLEQNYPNPFNPNTTITYELPNSSIVRLGVYDLLGREVAVLVDGRMDAGVHEARFDASGLASGVYLYRLEAGSFVQSRKLMLIR